MLRTTSVMLVVVLLAGCAATGPVDYAEVPSNYFSYDPDFGALQESYRMFGLDSVRPTSPQARARGFAALEYVSGAFQVHGRWDGLGGLADAQLMIARRDGRQALGILPTAKSQAVVDGLLAVSQAPNDDAVLAALANPVFSLGATATLDRLRNLPDLTEIGYALQGIGQGIAAQQFPNDID